MKLLLTGPQRLRENEGIDEPTAGRDRLAMELLYGGGLRVSELVGLSYGDIDFESGVARVLGKGRKERLCPLGRVAMAVMVVAEWSGPLWARAVTGTHPSFSLVPPPSSPRHPPQRPPAQPLPPPPTAPLLWPKTRPPGPPASATPMARFHPRKCPKPSARRFVRPIRSNR